MAWNITNCREKTPAQPTGEKPSIADSCATHMLEEGEILLSPFQRQIIVVKTIELHLVKILQLSMNFKKLLRDCKLTDT